jgi:hypothetical protein
VFDGSFFNRFLSMLITYIANYIANIHEAFLFFML